MPWKYYANFFFIGVAFVVAGGGIIWGSIMLTKHEQGIGLLIGAIAFLGIAIIGTIRQYGFSGSVSPTEIKSVIAVSLDDGPWAWVCVGLCVLGIVFFVALPPPFSGEATGTSHSALTEAPSHSTPQSTAKPQAHH